MKSLEANLSDYKSVHLNKKNIMTHFIGVPLILWSIALLLSGIQFTVDIDGAEQIHSLLPIIVLCIYIYYLLLDPKLAFVSILFLSPIFYHASLYSDHEYFFWLVAGVFIVGWLCQFLGHIFEKAKPAFIDDIAQLLIGPLFLIAELYFACGFGKDLSIKISKEAIIKRKSLLKNIVDSDL